MEVIMAIAAICQMHTGGNFNAASLAIKQQKECQHYYAKCLGDKMYYSTSRILIKKFRECMSNKKVDK